MNLLVFATQMERSGGIESHLREFSVRMTRLGVSVTFLCPSVQDPLELRRHLESAGVRAIIAGIPNRRGAGVLRLGWLFAQCMSLRLRSFDCLYTNGQGNLPAVLSRLLSRIPRVVHHHHTGLDSGDVESWPQSYRRFLGRVDTVVVCAQYLVAPFKEVISPRAVEAVYCYSRDVGVFHFDRSRVSAPTSEDVVHFGYFGRLIPEKGIDEIIKLAKDARLRHIQWHIWGVPGRYTQEYLGGCERLRFHGPFFGLDELRATLSVIDCYCLFSRHPEGLPIALMEVMSAGVPWMSTPQGGIPELMESGGGTRLLFSLEYDYLVEQCLAQAQLVRTSRQSFSRALHQRYLHDLSAPALDEKWQSVLFGTR